MTATSDSDLRDAIALHEGVKADAVAIGKQIADLRGKVKRLGSPINDGRLAMAADMLARICETCDLALAELERVSRG